MMGVTLVAINAYNYVHFLLINLLYALLYSFEHRFVGHLNVEQMGVTVSDCLHYAGFYIFEVSS